MLPPASAPATAIERVRVDEVAVAARGTTIHVAWHVPQGTGVNGEAPFHVHWRQSDGLAIPPPAMNAKGADVQGGFDVALTPIADTPGGKLVGDLDIVVCDTATHLVCVPLRRELELPFRVEALAPSAATVTVALPEAKS
jgi:hypothetical protein